MRETILLAFVHGGAASFKHVIKREGSFFHRFSFLFFFAVVVSAAAAGGGTVAVAAADSMVDSRHFFQFPTHIARARLYNEERREQKTKKPQN